MHQISPTLYLLNFPEFGSFVYLSLEEKILIDTSSPVNKDFLIKELAELGLKPTDIKYLFLTHTHYDHCGNLDLFSKAAVVTSQKNEQILKKNDDQIMHFARMGEKVPKVTNLNFSPRLPSNWQMIATPGHVVGSVCFYNQADKMLFSGDSIFSRLTLPRTDLSGSDIEDLKRSYSLLQTMNLEVDTLCPGHGEVQNMTNFRGYLEDLLRILETI